jgi:hypothetical protein
MAGIQPATQADIDAALGRLTEIQNEVQDLLALLDAKRPEPDPQKLKAAVERARAGKGDGEDAEAILARLLAEGNAAEQGRPS